MFNTQPRLQRRMNPPLWMLCVKFALIAFAATSHAAPIDRSFKLSKTQFNQGYCNIAEATIDVHLSESFGEPVITSRFHWVAGANTPRDCLPPQLDLWVEWQNERGRSAYMPITAYISQSEEPGEERLSSPTWNKVLCQTEAFSSRCFDQKTTLAFISTGGATDFELAQWETLVDATIKQPPKRSEPKIDLGLSLEDRLNQSIDDVLTKQDATVTGESALDRTSDNLSSVAALVATVNQELALYEVSGAGCQGLAKYQATKVSECRIVLQADIEWRQCQTNPGPPNTRQRVEIDFGEQSIQGTEVDNHSGRASLRITLDSPSVISDSQAINLFLLSARITERDTLQELARGFSTVQELCSLGRN